MLLTNLSGPSIIPMVIKKIVEFFSSLRLTVVLLAFAILLVFIGTLAQVDEGLYAAQARYFRQWIVLGAHLFGRKIPVVLPGGYLLGTLLLVNLVSAHIYRFEFTRKKIGIQLAHAGVILLLVGQLVTDMLARETQMHFDEGQTRSYAVSATDSELVFQTGDEVTAIPAKLLKSGSELKIGSLPFVIRVKSFWKNSEPSFRAPRMQNGPPLAKNGLALSFDFRELPEVKTTDARNVPTAITELLGSNGSLGDWVVSDWAGDDALVEAIHNVYASQMGEAMAQTITAKLVQPQFVDTGGRRLSFALQPRRFYQPFSLTLLKATHTVYPGTDIPKDFRSRVLLQNPATSEKREVEISMNHPLRYSGLTFYQYQMDAGQVAQQAGRTPSSVLQVVRNPGWLTPYLGCAMVGAGLVLQFLMHLTDFVSRRRTK
jgi:hypothetical protein